MLRALAILIVVPWGLADARTTMHCDHGIVQERDSIATVARRCAEPFWTERWETPRVVGRAHGEPVFTIETIEAWYLNFGSRRFMRRLVFRNGELWRIQQLGYGVGFEPGSRSCSPQELQRAGGTAGEIWARCGPPTHRYSYAEQARRGIFTGAGVPEIFIEVWTYDLGDSSLIRELTFRDGRLHRLRTIRR